MERSLAGALAVSVSAVPAQMPALTVTAQEAGAVNWEFDTIEPHGLDAAEGLDLEVLPIAGSSAGQIAFEAGRKTSSPPTRRSWGQGALWCPKI